MDDLHDRAARAATRPDPLTPEQRQRNMSQIRSRNTKPELIVRRALHAAGFRYRLHDRRLPGTPDIVMPRKGSVIQVHGCFWHGHGCPRSVTPSSNRDFWIEKINRNLSRDRATETALLNLGWRVFTVWECSLTGQARRSREALVQSIRDWLETEKARDEISGAWPSPPSE
jgi:DNA mismatch endonuclease (patch repair protein)